MMTELFSNPAKGKFFLFRKPPFQKRTGLTFIEIIVAAGLMGMVFIIGWGISNGILGVKKTRNYEIAIALASQAIEAARAARFREIGYSNDGRKDTFLAEFSCGRNIFDGEKGEGFVPVIKVGNVEFKREIQVNDCPSQIPGLPSGLKFLRVIIQWKAPEDGTPLVFETATTLADQW